MVGYYIWLFGLAFVAIINESTPHLVAACISSVIAVVWSVSQFLRTRAFQQEFDRFITYGACDGVELLPNYWKQRSSIEIPSLVFNCLFMLILGGLAFKLVSGYRKSTTKLVGGEKYVGHLYKVRILPSHFESERLLMICLQVVLVLSIVVQVTMFLIIASLALWVDELFEGVVASLSRTTSIFKGIAIVSLILALPWFILVRSHLSPFPFSLTNFRAVLDRCPQGKQILDGRFLHRYHTLYCLTQQHVRFGCIPPYLLGLAIFPLPYNLELVRSRYFLWFEHLVSLAVRSWSCLSTYVVIF